MTPEAPGIASKGRDSFIDVARLLTMLFIIMGHVNIRTPNGQGWSSSLCVLVAMTAFAGVPFFFFMAGYFAKPVGGMLNWRRTWEIFRSMLFWCVVGYFWFGMLQGAECELLVGEELFGVLGPWNSVATPGSWDCWFLKVLLPLVLVSGVLLKLHSPGLVVLACLSGVLSASGYKLECLPWFLSAESFAGLCYFSCGILVRRGLSIAEMSSWIGRVYPYVIGVTVLLAVVHCFWPHVFVLGRFMADFWGIIYVLSLSKVLCVLLPRFAGWFASFGTGVFFIYMMQEMLVMQCRWFFSLHPISKHAYALVPFGIFAVLMLGYWLVRRYLPWSCGLLCLSPVKKKG